MYWGMRYLVLYLPWKQTIVREENYTSLPEHGKTKITRWTRSLKRKYQTNKRMYPCNNNLGDEYRIFFSRWWWYSTRKQFLKTVFCLLPNTKKLQRLKSCNNIRVVRKLCLIVKAIFSTLKFSFLFFKFRLYLNTSKALQHMNSFNQTKSCYFRFSDAFLNFGGSSLGLILPSL